MPAQASVVELDRRPEIRFALGLLVVSGLVVAICVRIMQAGVGFWGFVAGMVSVVAGLGGLLAVLGLSMYRRRMVLVIDAAGVRREMTGAAPVWSVLWPDVASVRVRRRDGRQGSSLVIEPAGPEAVDRHRGVGEPLRDGEVVVRRVPLGRTDPVALEAALRRWQPRPGAGALPAPPPVPVAPVVPSPAGPPTRIDLTARNGTSRILLAVGSLLTAFFTVGLLATLIVGREGIGLRLVAGGVGIGLVLLFVALWWTWNRRPAALVMNHEHLLLTDRRERTITRVAWTDLRGVGVMTNEGARRRQRSGWLDRRMVSIPIWLELYPAGRDARRRHPELRRAWMMGRPRREDQEQRWLIGIGDGLGQAPPVGEHVRRWRPHLWRGHRDGSFLSG